MMRLLLEDESLATLFREFWPVSFSAYHGDLETHRNHIMKRQYDGKVYGEAAIFAFERGHLSIGLDCLRQVASAEYVHHAAFGAFMKYDSSDEAIHMAKANLPVHLFERLLLYAASIGDSALADRLIGMGVSLPCQGHRAFLTAAMHGQTGFMQYYIRKVDVRYGYMEIAFRLAVNHGCSHAIIIIQQSLNMSEAAQIDPAV